MFKLFYFLYIELILSNLIVENDKIKLFTEQSNEIINRIMNDMILLEILPIKISWGISIENVHVTELVCMYCFKHLSTLRKKYIYIFKYVFKIISENCIIIICKQCFINLKDNMDDEKVNLINNSSDLNQQESYSENKKLNVSKIVNKPSIHEFLSVKIIKSLSYVKYYTELFKDKDYRAISLHKILEIKLILKNLYNFDHIYNFDCIFIKNIENFNYYILDRFNIEHVHFNLKSEILINKNLYFNIKLTTFIEKINKLQTIQTNIDNGKIITLFESVVKKEHIWFNDIYLNLILLNEISKNNYLIFNKFRFKRKYLNVTKYIYIYENFTKNIKNEIQKKFSTNWINYNDYVFIIEQLYYDIESFDKFNKSISYIYNKNQFENTIITYYKINKKQNRILNIENNILSLNFI